MSNFLSSKIILFDIDYTLIDTDKLRKITHDKILQTTKIPPQELEKATKKFAETLKTSREFSPPKYAIFLANYFTDPLLKKKVGEIFSRPSVYQPAIYPDVMPSLKKLRPTYSLGIFSEGIRKYQIAKITLSGIISYLDQNLIFIFVDKTGKGKFVAEKVGKCHIVDDNPRHITDLRGIENITPIWLKCGPKAKTEEILNCPTILSLEELCNSKL